MARILILDDDKNMRDTLEECFATLGYDTVAVETGQEAMDLLSEGSIFDVAFFDIDNEKGFGGIETIERMKKNNPILPFPIVVMSGNTTHDAIINPGNYGFEGSFKKTSMRLQNLQNAVEEALKKAGA